MITGLSLCCHLEDTIHSYRTKFHLCSVFNSFSFKSLPKKKKKKDQDTQNKPRLNTIYKKKKKLRVDKRAFILSVVQWLTWHGLHVLLLCQHGTFNNHNIKTKTQRYVLFLNETAVYHKIETDQSKGLLMRRKKISTNMAIGDKAEPFIYSFNFKGIADSDNSILFQILFKRSFTTCRRNPKLNNTHAVSHFVTRHCPHFTSILFL